MNKYLSNLSLVAIAALSLTACTKDDMNDTPSFRPKINYTSLSPNSNYFEVFKDKEGAQTVDFSGQTLRQDMLAEMDSVMKIATGTYASKGVAAAPVSASVLKSMYAHAGSPFRTAELNAATDKVLKGKTAASFSASDAATEQARFDTWLDKVATSSAAYNKVAADGQAGIATSASGSKYLVDEKGIEYPQLVQKGLIGAVLMDQLVNVYLGTEKLSLDNSKLTDGKKYTAREHSWDEAYGYLTKNGVYPMPNPADATKYLERYLGNYVRPVGDPAQLFLAFLKGRAAIVNNDNTVRDQQVAFIRQHIETAIASFAISYLNKTKSLLTSDVPSAMHAFAEGAGFVYALRFANSKRITTARSEAMLDKLIGGVKGFYSLTPAKMDEVINEIATAYSLSPSLIVNH